MSSTTPADAAQPRRRRLLAVGVVAAGLSVAGTGAAVALAPTSPLSRAVNDALHAVGVEMPNGYTSEQYDAFWGAGYTPEDVEALAALWQTEATETKARAGQLLLDGRPVPLPPSGPTPDVSAGDPHAPGTDMGDEGPSPDPTALDAYFAAGYTYEDALALGALWSTDVDETKARAGELLLEGQTLPVAPGSSVAADPAP